MGGIFTRRARCRRGQSLVRRTRSAFATMLLWALATAVVSLAAVNSLVTTLRDEAAEAEDESALRSALPRALSEAEGAGYDLLDLDDVDYFESTQDDALGLLDDAERLLRDDDEARALDAVRARFDETFAPLRAVADDAGDPEVDLHDHLGVSGEQLRLAVYDLEDVVRAETRSRLAAGEDAQRRLTVVLCLLFGLSMAMTIFFARRIRHDVVEPVQALGSSARRFASGEFDHRSDVDRPEEFAQLADSFNAMAEVLDANQQTLTQQAYHDALTGLANRRGFGERLSSGFAASAALATGVGVLFIDLDDFKVVNDSLGHAAGDDVLRQVARRIGECVRTTDLVARLGGDEFAVLLAPPTSRAVAVGMAQRVLDSLAEPMVVGGEPVSAAASIGVAVQGPSTGSADELLQQADTAMYLAKGRGKQRFEVHAGA
jgi:diguanylate cyclase (GGDEF)-like protein